MLPINRDSVVRVQGNYDVAEGAQHSRERLASQDYRVSSVVRVSGLGSARLAHGEITGSEDEDAVWQQQQQQHSDRHRRRPPPPRRVPGVERLLDSDEDEDEEEPPPHLRPVRIADHLSRERDYRDRNHRERDFRQLRDDYVEHRHHSSRQNTLEDYEYEHRESTRPAQQTNQPAPSNAPNNQVIALFDFC